MCIYFGNNIESIYDTQEHITISGRERMRYKPKRKRE